MITMNEALKIAHDTMDAYSYDRYAPDEWARAADGLAQRGYSARQIEAILRSKWTRWAADQADRQQGEAMAADLFIWMKSVTQRQVEDLTRETFGG